MTFVLTLMTDDNHFFTLYFNLRSWLTDILDKSFTQTIAK